MEVRAAEVGVHEHDLATHARELVADGGGDQRLADAALAAPHRPHLAARTGRRHGNDRGQRLHHGRRNVTLARRESTSARVGGEDFHVSRGTYVITQRDSPWPTTVIVRWRHSRCPWRGWS